jgi:hypothetical protein
VLPLLWSLVIDKLFKDLDRQGFEMIGFSNDLVIMERGNNDPVLSWMVQTGRSEHQPRKNYCH